MRRVESFYGSAILVSNTLGTARGDFLADDSGLGYAGSVLQIGSSLALLSALRRWRRVQPTLLLLAAFVLTRSFGATFVDLLTKPTAAGGLALGTIGSSAVLLRILVAMAAWTTRQVPTRRPARKAADIGHAPARTKGRAMR